MIDMNIRKLMVLCAFFVLTAAVQAEVRLNKIFCDQAVLQRDKPLPIWGSGDPGEKVTVSFAGQSKTVAADKHGRWSVTLSSLPASSEGRTLSVTGNQSGKPIVLSDVVVGDVWLTSGQSNMSFCLAQASNAGDAVKNGNYPLIRQFRVDAGASDLAQQEPPSSSKIWLRASPQFRNVGNFTAVGYFFALKLYQELDVPIGLIGASWGGTKIEPWIAPEGYRRVPELKAISDKVEKTIPSSPQGKAAYLLTLKDMKAWVSKTEEALEEGAPIPPQPTFPSVGTSHQEPTRIYNAMIHPLIPYAIRGVIWYQGEGNGSEGVSYFQKKRALIEGWRLLWEQGDPATGAGQAFPFYFVQLANYQTSPDVPAGGDGWAKVREAQRQTLSLPNTGMAVAVDVGEEKDIHPKNKQDVGLRLAAWALAKEYGLDVVASGPLYKSHTVEGNTIRVTFDYPGGGLMVASKEGITPPVEVKGGKLAHFSIAGADKVWHWADAKIDGDTVIVSSPKVATPVAVRYAFRHNPKGVNFYNRAGLPASPFRTDNW